jgi:uncharacterized protein YbjT (DUF2867 family)
MILVIGGTGRLGRLLVGGLGSEHEVRVLSRHATTADPPMPGAVEVVDGDIRDRAALAQAAEGAACIVMAAHGVESRERGGLASVDELGSRAVAAVARSFGSHIVLVSTAGARADAPLLLDRTKWAAEQVVRESGVPWTIVRAAPYAQTWAMILTMSADRSGRPGIIGSGMTPHHFVDVRDVAAVVTRAVADESLRGRILLVSGPDALTLRQLAAMMQEATSWSGSPRHLPSPLASAIGVVLGVFRPHLARRLTIAASLNDPEPVQDDAADAPSWFVPRTITPDAIAAASDAARTELH